jgi:8-oxo-dGTP pyrophosphatase MutT (NUDIX family)
MYKVFLNDREILIARPTNQNPFQSFEVFENIQKVDEVKDWFSKFVNETKTNALIIQDNPDEFMTAVFSPAFTQIEAAGGIVKRNGRILFIFRNGKWDLPKGKIDPGETPEQAAIREVEEECGIRGHRIVKSLPPTLHIYQSTWKESAGNWILKKTHWFEMEYTGTEDGIPETVENITDIKWVEKEELNEIYYNTYLNIKETISSYLI